MIAVTKEKTLQIQIEDKAKKAEAVASGRIQFTPDAPPGWYSRLQERHISAALGTFFAALGPRALVNWPSEAQRELRTLCEDIRCQQFQLVSSMTVALLAAANRHPSTLDRGYYCRTASAVIVVLAVHKYLAQKTGTTVTYGK